MRRVALVALVCSLPGPGLWAQELPRTPILVFREPDPATRREITRELISGKALGGPDNANRTRARARLAQIGPWAVPFLAAAVHGRKRERSVRVRMNAVLALALIQDPRCLPQLRGAAVTDSDVWVRHCATLALGVFRRAEDVETVEAMLGHRNAKLQYGRAAAPALAKLKQERAAVVLEARSRHLPKDKYTAAAIVLSAAVASPNAELASHLDHKDNLVRQAAATGLIIRPSVRHAPEILKALDKPRLDPRTRVLLVHALGAIPVRSDEIRARLLDLATRSSAKGPERIAALIELDCRPTDYGALKRAYGRLRGRNDAVVAAIIDALARTGHPDAVQFLTNLIRGGSDFVKFYAVASLVRQAVFAMEPAAQAEIMSVVPKNHRDPFLRKLGGLVGRIAYLSRKPVEQRRLVREGFAEISDPKNLRLWDQTQQQRAWKLVNRMLAEIFQLDYLVTQFDAGKEGRTAESSLDGGDEGESDGGSEAEGGGSGQPQRKTPSATAEELDLSDYFAQQPYFGPEDLGGG